MDIDIIRLKNLALKARPGPWELAKATNGITFLYEIYAAGIPVADCEREKDSAAFIAAANPAAILELIAEIEQLSFELFVAQRAAEKMARNNMDLHYRLTQLDKEANWLAEQLAQNDNAAVSCRDNCEQGLPCLRPCRAKKWREAARKAVEEDDG